MGSERFCGDNPTNLNAGGGDVDIDLKGGSETPSWMDGAAFKDAALVPYGNSSPFKYYDLFTLKGLKLDTRVRVTLNWDACPAGESGAGPSLLSADLDLWLCNDAAQICFKSRSFDNDWEGFDTEDFGGIPAAGDWTIRVGYDPSNSPGCGGATDEPTGIAYVYGPKADFVEYPN
jgi:hypothetical protein